MCMCVQWCPTLCNLMNYNLPGSSVHGILKARILGQPIPFPGDLLNPGIQLGSPILQADYLPFQPRVKPKNTGVGSLSLLQGIFWTPESNWVLLHCRWIYYQLSYQGSPSYNYLWKIQYSAMTLKREKAGISRKLKRVYSYQLPKL